MAAEQKQDDFKRLHQFFKYVQEEDKVYGCDGTLAVVAKNTQYPNSLPLFISILGTNDDGERRLYTNFLISIAESETYLGQSFTDSKTPSKTIPIHNHIEDILQHPGIYLWSTPLKVALNQEDIFECFILYTVSNNDCNEALNKLAIEICHKIVIFKGSEQRNLESSFKIEKDRSKQLFVDLNNFPTLTQGIHRNSSQRGELLHSFMNVLTENLRKSGMAKWVFLQPYEYLKNEWDKIVNTQRNNGGDETGNHPPSHEDSIVGAQPKYRDENAEILDWLSDVSGKEMLPTVVDNDSEKVHLVLKALKKHGSKYYEQLLGVFDNMVCFPADQEIMLENLIRNLRIRDNEKWKKYVMQQDVSIQKQLCEFHTIMGDGMENLIRTENRSIIEHESKIGEMVVDNLVECYHNACRFYVQEKGIRQNDFETYHDGLQAYLTTLLGETMEYGSKSNDIVIKAWGQLEKKLSSCKEEFKNIIPSEEQLFEKCKRKFAKQVTMYTQNLWDSIKDFDSLEEKHTKYSYEVVRTIRCSVDAASRIKYALASWLNHHFHVYWNNAKPLTQSNTERDKRIAIYYALHRKAYKYVQTDGEFDFKKHLASSITWPHEVQMNNSTTSIVQVIYKVRDYPNEIHVIGKKILSSMRVKSKRSIIIFIVPSTIFIKDRILLLNMAENLDLQRFYLINESSMLALSLLYDEASKLDSDLAFIVIIWHDLIQIEVFEKLKDGRGICMIALERGKITSTQNTEGQHEAKFGQLILNALQQLDDIKRKARKMYVVISDNEALHSTFLDTFDALHSFVLCQRHIRDLMKNALNMMDINRLREQIQDFVLPDPSRFVQNPASTLKELSYEEILAQPHYKLLRKCEKIEYSIKSQTGLTQKLIQETIRGIREEIRSDGVNVKSLELDLDQLMKRTAI